MVDDVLDKSYMRFLLHYNFPPFSNWRGQGWQWRRPPRRRCHGRLAWRPQGAKSLPTTYTVRVVSDILRVKRLIVYGHRMCGTLALMDAGVPIKAPVSGIAAWVLSRTPARTLASPPY